MFEAAGFRMFDLGRDVPANSFVDEAIKEQADVICISSLMTTAMMGMADVISGLAQQGARQRHRVMVGGACVSAAFAQRIGADGYAPNAMAAVNAARTLLEASAIEQ
jgi:methanogenic corrinoid protein MtbC1